MSHSLKRDGEAHTSNHPKGVTSEEYNIARRKFEYPKKNDPKLVKSAKNMRVHSLEKHDPRFRVLHDWKECTNQTGPNKCTTAGLKGYFVRLEDGTLRRAFKLFKGMGKCGTGDGVAEDEAEMEGQAEDADTEDGKDGEEG